LKPNTVLVDGDILLYITRDPAEPASYVLHSVKLMLESIQKNSGCDNMRVFLSSPTNFRYGVDPEYKANRKDKEKPPHYLTTKNYLKKYYNAEVSEDGYEADDTIAKIMLEEGDSVMVASLDKDFLTIAGWHLKWRHHNKDNPFYVTEEDAEAFLCYQLLVGDTADHIMSPLKKYKKDGTLSKVGLGAVAARDFLLQCTYEHMRDYVKDEYDKQGFFEDFAKNYKLLAIGRIDIESLKD